MYEVLIKGEEYFKIGEETDYKNAVEKAINQVALIIDYFNGVGNCYFMKDHPSSTINTPKFYCIPGDNVYRIYEHIKLKGWVFSEHLYEKKYTVKIIKSRDREFINSEEKVIKNKLNDYLNRKLLKIFNSVSERQISLNPSVVVEEENDKIPLAPPLPNF